MTKHRYEVKLALVFRTPNGKLQVMTEPTEWNAYDVPAGVASEIANDAGSANGQH